MKMKNSPQTLQGFTLLELLITLSIAAILVSLTAPSFQQTIDNNRLNTLNDKLLTFLRAARTEALSRSRAITVCPSNDQATCSGSWGDGWIMFVDNDADRVLDSGDDELLKAGDSGLEGYSVSLISDVSDSAQFNNEGRSVERGTYQLCGPNSTNSDARGIIMQLSGALRYALDSDSDGVRETHAGADLSC